MATRLFERPGQSSVSIGGLVVAERNQNAAAAKENPAAVKLTSSATLLLNVDSPINRVGAFRLSRKL
jgi:hypothetical protein